MWAECNYLKGNISFKVINDSSNETLSKWKVSFSVPDGTKIVQNSLSDYAIVILDGNVLTISSSDKTWNFLKPGETYTRNSAIQISIPKDSEYELNDGHIVFDYLSSETQSGTGSGVASVNGNADDMNADLTSINVELIRQTMWGQGVNTAAIYDVIVTNISDKEITDWSFTLVLPDDITNIDAWAFSKEQVDEHTFILRPTDASVKKLKPGESTKKITTAFKFDMKDANAIPEIK